MPRPHPRGATRAPRARTTLALALTALLTACGPPEQAEPRDTDPSLRTLDRLLAKDERGARGFGAGRGDDVVACVARARAVGRCPLAAGGAPRVLPLRLALDLRYTTHWPEWESRLAQTLACVNRLYVGAGIVWKAQEVRAWDPGAERHQLLALLRRLQRERPPDGRSLVVGITLWEERRVYSTAGGEIGLSQRGACVVPSWPRVENDCLILAHELGHLAGARHVPGKQWIMGWAARPFFLPATDPISRVVATYRFHPRNVEALRAHAGARFTAAGLTLPVGCEEHLARVDRCWRL